MKINYNFSTIIKENICNALIKNITSDKDYTEVNVSV